MNLQEDNQLIPEKLIYLKIAQSVNYKIFKANSKNSLEKILGKIKQNSGPILIHVQVSKSTEKSSRVDIDPPNIKSRFIKAIN